MKIDRILAATDLSAPSRHAVDRAFALAAAGAQLTLLHVVNQRSLDDLQAMLGERASGVARHIEDAARESLAEIAGDQVRNRGVAASLRVVEGAVLATLCAEADALDADLLLLGARGEGFLRHLLLGSTASRLLRKTTRPVLLVKQPMHEPYRRVLVPVDFSPRSRIAIELARAVAPEARIVLLNAFEVPFEGKLTFAGVDEEVIRQFRAEAQREAALKLAELARTAALPADRYLPLVRHGDPAQRILEQEQEQDCDLIVMGKHGQFTVEELLLGSVTKHVLADSQCDVLVSAGG
jgi:nucleotide-binding universal stress UspA family protein